MYRYRLNRKCQLYICFLSCNSKVMEQVVGAVLNKFCTREQQQEIGKVALDFCKEVKTLMEHFNCIVGAVANNFFTRTEQQQIGKVSREVIKEVKTREMAGNNFVRVAAGLSGAVAVAMAAYGAHAFNHGGSEEEQKLKNVFESGNKMHLFHTVALMAVPLTRNPHLVGCTMATGMLIFSGSCYYQAITKDGRIRKITPYGGMLLIISWLLMIP